jgi:Fe-S cluster assembly protein SufD
LPPVRETTPPEAGSSQDETSPVPRKRGASREATLNYALDGVGTPRMALAESRALAREAYGRLPLPAWRRSGFWTTSLESLELEALDSREHGADGARPAFLAGAPAAGVLVQRDASVVHLELDAELASAGVILCSLEQAAELHTELFERYYLRRLRVDRHKLEAASAAFWRGGAFLYVPPGLRVADPFQIVYEISEGRSVQYAHTLAIGDRESELRLREYCLAGETEGQSLHARQSELYLEDAARARFAQLVDWGQGQVHDVSTTVVEVARDAYCHWLPALLGGALIHHHDEIAIAGPGGDMAFRGVFFAERSEHLDVFAVDLHETGPSGGDVHWRGAASGESRASFEGLIKINPGAQQSHTYLQFHSMLLSSEAELDAIPSVLVGADDVSASHGGTVGELDEMLIFYMQSRGLTRPQAVRVIVEGFFEPLIVQLDDPHLEDLVRARIGNKLAAAAQDIERYALAR